MPEGITGRHVEDVRGVVPRGKILLVDEDTKDLQLYTSVLREQGHVVDCCATYLEGAERLERGGYDLIILSQGGRTFEGQPCSNALSSSTGVALCWCWRGLFTCAVIWMRCTWERTTTWKRLPVLGKSSRQCQTAFCLGVLRSRRGA